MARERGLYRRKDSRLWWIGLVLADGRRVCQSTGCINRTNDESYVVRLKNEVIEAKQQGLLGIFVWQQAVMRYLEEFADKRSLSDDKDHLKKLDPYLRSLKLDAIDMTVLQPFIRDRKVKDGVSNATVNRALEVVRRILNVAHQDWRWLKGVPKIRMLKEPRRRVRFLRREEADRLIVGQGEAARRHRGLPLPRLETYLGLVARAERHFVAGADGTGRMEVVRDGAAL
jgi:hypothetical protein